MGRADQATKVKGMFVQPAQVAAVLKRHAEIGRARLVVTTTSPTSPSATGSPVPGRTISTTISSSTIMPSMAGDS